MTPASRYLANLSALRLLADLDARPHIPTVEDIATLSAYEGWADGRVRRLGYDAIGVCHPELRAALESLNISPNSLVNAGGLSAYHTPRELAQTVTHLACQALGHLPRNVLEPSAGTGKFLEYLTAETAVAVEPNPVFSRILRLRFPAWQVRPTTLERSGLVAPSFDLVVGNAPFGDWGVVDADAPPALRHRHLQARVHDYFLCKAVSLLVPGGVAAMIVHASTMDRAERGVREWLSERAELVCMHRLPADLWESQGASVVADLVVVRKR